MNVDYSARQAKLRQIGADAVVIVPGANMIYFTGLKLHLSERPSIALFTADGMGFIMPELELPKLRERPDLAGQVFSWSDRDGYTGAFEQALRELGLRGKTLAVDGLTMRVFESLAFQAADSSVKIANVGTDLLRIRVVKTQDEIEAIRKANALSEAALERVMAEVKPGMSERAIAAHLAEALGAQGSEGLAFEPLVQTGPNSALPHGMLSDRKLQADEFLLIDYGGKYADYPADITRTFCLGKPSAEMQKIYDTVLRANLAAIQASGPGVTCGAVDKAARDVIAEAGYGTYFIHRTGHGLGLESHELPQIAADVPDHLQPGMVFTIEPGIYIPGLGGVRIEDNVAITETGVDVLTTYAKQFVYK